MNGFLRVLSRARRPRPALVGLLALGAGVLLLTGLSGASDDASALAEELQQLVRGAEKDIAAGALAEAGDKLDRAEEVLARLKAAEPRHRAVRPWTARLGTARKNYEEAVAAGPVDTSAADAAEAATASAEADARRMIELYDTYYPRLDLIHGNSLVYGVEISHAQTALDDVLEAEATVPEFADELGRMADLYGTQPMEIGNNLHAKGVKISGDPGGRMAYLIEAMGKVGKSRVASAESCVRNAEMFLDAFSEQITDVYLERMDKAKKILVIGQKLDPGNAKIVEMLATVDDQIAAAAEKMQAQIDAATWAGNMGGFPGPGSAAGLAKEALSFFRNHDGWGGRTDKKIEVLKVCVRGPWQVAERDIFGRVISWRLPIHVAVTDPDLRPRNIARVYELSILALEGAPGRAPKQPPFGGYWVGNSWMMRLDRF